MGGDQGLTRSGHCGKEHEAERDGEKKKKIPLSRQSPGLAAEVEVTHRPVRALLSAVLV